MSYLLEGHGLDMLIENGIEVIMHVPVFGRVALKYTMGALEGLLRGTRADIVVWKNEYFGAISSKEMQLVDTQLMKEHPKRVLGHISGTTRS